MTQNDGSGLRSTLAFVVLGLFATPFSVGFQGLDALGVPLSGVTEPAVWQAGLGTTFGRTAVIAALSFGMSLLAMTASQAAARIFSSIAMLGVGAAPGGERSCQRCRAAMADKADGVSPCNRNSLLGGCADPAGCRTEARFANLFRSAATFLRGHPVRRCHPGPRRNCACRYPGRDACSSCRHGLWKRPAGETGAAWRAVHACGRQPLDADSADVAWRRLRHATSGPLDRSRNSDHHPDLRGRGRLALHAAAARAGDRCRATRVGSYPYSQGHGGSRDCAGRTGPVEVRSSS